METILPSSFHHEAYEIECCSKRKNNRAYWALQNSIKIDLGSHGPMVWKSDCNISFHSKMYGRVLFQKLFTMKHMRKKVGFRKSKIQLIELYNIPSKNFGGGMDLSWEKSTWTSFPIVK